MTILALMITASQLEVKVQLVEENLTEVTGKKK
jgi:hypothetical protein